MSCGVTNEEFKKISSTEVAKEALTILEITYEGTKAVKTMKLQRLTSSFKDIGKFRPRLIELTSFKPKLLIRFIINKTC